MKGCQHVIMSPTEGTLPLKARITLVKLLTCALAENTRQMSPSVKQAKITCHRQKDETGEKQARTMRAMSIQLLTNLLS